MPPLCVAACRAERSGENFRFLGRICERGYIYGDSLDDSKLNTISRKVARFQIFLCTRVADSRNRELLANDREIRVLSQVPSEFLY